MTPSRSPTESLLRRAGHVGDVRGRRVGQHGAVVHDVRVQEPIPGQRDREGREALT